MCTVTSSSWAQRASQWQHYKSNQCNVIPKPCAEITKHKSHEGKTRRKPCEETPKQGTPFNATDS